MGSLGFQLAVEVVVVDDGVVSETPPWLGGD